MNKSTPLQEFKNKIQGISHPEYPFLHKTYSPNSRVPCTDLIPFISERLKERDISSITGVMHEVLRANPGLSFSIEWSAEPSDDEKTKSRAAMWIDQPVKTIAQMDFKPYVVFADTDAYYQLQASFIVAEKSGGDRKFWIKDEYPRLFAWCLCVYQPVWQEKLAKLVDQGNSFIDTMAKEHEFWKDFPRLDKPGISDSVKVSANTLDIIKGLSPAARMHLLYAVSRLRPGEIWRKRGGHQLSELTNYAIRSFGINLTQTTQEIINTGLLTKSKESRAYVHRKTKEQLMQACEKTNTSYKKSWKKAEVFEALEKNAPEYIAEEMDQLDLVVINPKHEEDLLALVDYAEKLVAPFKLLCFI